MRLVTWNVNSLKARLPRVTQWIEENSPDVLCMQETKQADEAFPADVFTAMGYESAHHGDGRWNGVAIVSRVGLDDVTPGFSSGADEVGCRLIAATCRGARIHCVYVPNGRSLDSEQYPKKLQWLTDLRSEIDATCSPGDDVAVCGDFNVAPQDRDVWDPAAFVGATHVSGPERDGLQGLMDWGLVDSFRLHTEDDGRFSWWDYRAGDFHQGRGMRIDLVLLSEPLARRCSAVRMDRDARKGQKPSDHIPVEATID